MFKAARIKRKDSQRPLQFKCLIMKKFIRLVGVVAFIITIQSQPRAQVNGVDAVGFTVSDMDRSVRFYTEVLHFRKISDVERVGEHWEKLFDVFGLRIRVVRMQLGAEIIELVDYLTTGGRSIPEDARSNDLIFQHLAIVVSDIDSAYQLLRKYKVTHVSTGPQTLPGTIAGAEGIKAFYFQDPDKHNLELIYYPKGKGQEKWQNSGGKIFLGIDHTAIAVSSTESSHLFYEGILGIQRKGESWNKGTEQEHLNNVKGASLHITGYRAGNGVGIEFLEYLYPGPGKKYPQDTRSDDYWNWHTILRVDDAAMLFNRLKDCKTCRLVSKELMVRRNNEKIIERSFLVRDPDGHALLILETDG